MNDSAADITRLLEALAVDQPAAPAIHAPGRRTLRYSDLGAQIRYVRERLGQWNVGRGDIVAGVVSSRPEMALACATIPASATLAPLSPSLATGVYCELFSRMRPKALLVSEDVEHPVRIAARRCAVAELGLAFDPRAGAGTCTLELTRREDSLDRSSTTPPEWAYLLATSGTSGRAKLVPRSHRLTAALAAHLGDWLQLTSDDVGCHLVPLHHSHGLNAALMLPLLRGGSVVCLAESDIARFFAALVEQKLTWFTAPVTHQREILRRAPEFRAAIARNTLRFIRVSAGRLEPEEMERIEEVFGAPVLMGYGMTEATPVSHQPLPPRVRKRGSAGLPLCGQVAIMGEVGIDCDPGKVGEIVVRNPLVFDGYFDDPEATAAAFVDGWFRTGDLGRFDADNHLYVVGRIKDIINRGGEKISLPEIDAAIEAVPGVRAAAAFGIPHQTLGEELAAAVVRERNTSVSGFDILERVVETIGAKRVPRRIYFVDQLPRTDVGKVRRSELLGLLRPGSRTMDSDDSAAEAGGKGAGPLEAALIGLWGTFLPVGSIDRHDDFFLLGGDSLRGTELLSCVEALFGVDLPLESLFGNAATVAGMARAIVRIRANDRGIAVAHDGLMNTACDNSGAERTSSMQESGPAR